MDEKTFYVERVYPRADDLIRVAISWSARYGAGYCEPEDLVQDALCWAWENLHRFDQMRSPMSYLVGRMRFIAKGRYRKTRNHSKFCDKYRHVVPVSTEQDTSEVGAQDDDTVLTNLFLTLEDFPVLHAEVKNRLAEDGCWPLGTRGKRVTPRKFVSTVEDVRERLKEQYHRLYGVAYIMVCEKQWIACTAAKMRHEVGLEPDPPEVLTGRERAEQFVVEQLASLEVKNPRSLMFDDRYWKLLRAAEWLVRIDLSPHFLTRNAKEQRMRAGCKGTITIELNLYELDRYREASEDQFIAGVGDHPILLDPKIPQPLGWGSRKQACDGVSSH